MLGSGASVAPEEATVALTSLVLQGLLASEELGLEGL